MFLARGGQPDVSHAIWLAHMVDREVNCGAHKPSAYAHGRPGGRPLALKLNSTSGRSTGRSTASCAEQKNLHWTVDRAVDR